MQCLWNYHFSLGPMGKDKFTLTYSRVVQYQQQWPYKGTNATGSTFTDTWSKLFSLYLFHKMNNIKHIFVALGGPGIFCGTNINHFTTWLSYWASNCVSIQLFPALRCEAESGNLIAIHNTYNNGFILHVLNLTFCSNKYRAQKHRYTWFRWSDYSSI